MIFKTSTVGQRERRRPTCPWRPSAFRGAAATTACPAGSGTRTCGRGTPRGSAQASARGHSNSTSRCSRRPRPSAGDVGVDGLVVSLAALLAATPSATRTGTGTTRARARRGAGGRHGVRRDLSGAGRTPAARLPREAASRAAYVEKKNLCVWTCRSSRVTCNPAFSPSGGALSNKKKPFLSLSSISCGGVLG